MNTYKDIIINIYETEIPNEKRTIKNIPRYSTGKFRIPFKEWLGLKGNPSKGYDGKYYGWSHRAIYGFGAGDNVAGDSMAHKDYNWDDDNDNRKHKSYVIKDDADAKEHAKRFRDEVS